MTYWIKFPAPGQLRGEGQWTEVSEEDHAQYCMFLPSKFEAPLPSLKECPVVVNPIRPDHYGGLDDPYEVIKVIDAWKLGFNDGNALKYIGRAGKKDGNTRVQDLRKAIQYLEFEIEKENRK